MGLAQEAILLVGGQGTRLRPLTSRIPKPMLPTAGVPLLTHQLVRLREAGVSHVVLATSYRTEVFSEYFGDGSKLGITLDYVVETEPLGTGGGIRNAASRLESPPDAPVLIFNGDVLSGHDLGAQLQAHAASGADVTLHLLVVSDPRAFGCVPTDPDGRVTAFLEKSLEPISDQVNAGCYIFRRSVIDAIPPDLVVSVERDTFPGLLTAGAHVHGHLEQAYWLDLGTPAAYVQGSADLVTGVLASAAVPVTGGALVDPTAQVDADAALDRGSAIGPTAVVGAGALVSGSVVLAGAIIEAGALVVDSVVGAGALVGARTRLTGVVIGDGARVGADNELIVGARVWTDAVLSDRSVRFSPDA